MTANPFPVRWIPKRNPPFYISLLITIGAAGAVFLAMWSVISVRQSIILTGSVLFPGLILISLYAGWRWSLGVVVALGALMGWWISRGNAAAIPIQIWISLAFYFGSLLVCVLVAGATRALVIDLDEARQARMRAEGDIRESESRFGVLADSAPTLMWVSRGGAGRIFVNAAYSAFFGLPAEEARRLDWRSLLHPDDKDRIAATLKEYDWREGPLTMEARYRRGDGEWRWMRTISQPRLDADGRPDGYVGIGMDISDAKKAEADLKGINELLAERIADALADRDRAQAALMQAQKLDAIGQLTGGVAHDFNNLLTVIIGALDIIERHPTDERRRTRMAEAAMAAARRGEQLNQQLLGFARRKPLHPLVIALDDQLSQAETLMRRAIGEAVALEFRLEARNSHVLIDPGQLEAAVLNLLINARDAVAEGGHITLSTARLKLREPRGEVPPGDYLVIGVSDDGVGMDAETLSHVFEPFFTTKAVGKGTGLGLAQVYGFAKQSSGYAEVESKAGEGTTVRIVLPLSREKPPRVASPKVADQTERAPLKILLVEDDADVGELVEAMLRELGHKVVRASDARSALKLMVTEPELSLMLTDVIMPGGKNGVELAREVTEVRPDIPIILSSGYTGESLAGAEAAPWPLLRKPYTLEALSGTINSAVEARLH